VIGWRRTVGHFVADREFAESTKQLFVVVLLIAATIGVVVGGILGRAAFM